MSEAILVNALEQLVPFLNEKNVLELVVRGNNKRIKAFQKVALDGLAHGEEQALVNKAIHALNANTGMAQRSLQLVQDVTKMQQLGLVLNGLNLCATCAGFAVMYAKLDSMSTEINRQFLQLQNMMKQGHDLQASYEFDKVLSEHTNMMDCRKTKKPYSEEKMRELVDAEYNVLKLLTGVAEKGLAADHQNMLVMLDDDMKMEALTQTNNIKAIVTAELPMDLERKGQQSYQADMRVRFLALGNGRMQALHDRSYGFFRRQILLEAKERPPDRRDDPYLAQRLCAEKEGIFLWAFAGLQRLVANNFHFTLSQQAQENMEAAIAEGNNLVEFIKSEGYFRFQADSEVSSRDFYTVYLQWCMDNALSSLAQKTVINYLKQNSRQYNLEYTNKISIGDGRFARGFWGIQLLKK